METIKLFRQFKLGNSVFTGHFEMVKEDAVNYYIPIEEIERHSKRDMIEQLSDAIISKNSSAITKDEFEGKVRYKCELLVLKLADFKTIVEAAIQMMPQDAIDKVRQGGEI